MAAALEAQGVDAPLVEVADVRVDLGRREARSPAGDLFGCDGIVIKKVGRSYGPENINYLEILRFVNDAGIPCFSKPAAILRVYNRAACSLTLAGAGLPLPPTVITENAEDALAAVSEYGEAILKPLYTSKARGMEYVTAGPEASARIARYRERTPGPLYVQKKVDNPGRDLGITFLGGEYLATYARVGQPGAWATTTAAGGRYEAYHPDDSVLALAARAQSLFGLDFTCVDVAETNDGPVIFEVSAFGGFRGLLEGNGIDAAALLADYVRREVRRGAL